MRSVSDRQKQTKVEDKMVWKAGFWAHSETVKKWWKVIGSCSEVNRHVRMKVAERGGWVIWIGGIVIDVGSSFQRLDEACCVFGVCFFPAEETTQWIRRQHSVTLSDSLFCARPLRLGHLCLPFILLHFVSAVSHLLYCWFICGHSQIKSGSIGGGRPAPHSGSECFFNKLPFQV